MVVELTMDCWGKGPMAIQGERHFKRLVAMMFKEKASEY